MKVGDLVKWRNQKFIVLGNPDPNAVMTVTVNMKTGETSSFPTHWLEVISESK